MPSCALYYRADKHVRQRVRHVGMPCVYCYRYGCGDDNARRENRRTAWGGGWYRGGAPHVLHGVVRLSPKVWKRQCRFELCRPLGESTTSSHASDPVLIALLVFQVSDHDGCVADLLESGQAVERDTARGQSFPSIRKNPPSRALLLNLIGDTGARDLVPFKDDLAGAMRSALDPCRYWRFGRRGSQRSARGGRPVAPSSVTAGHGRGRGAGRGPAGARSAVLRSGPWPPGARVPGAVAIRPGFEVGRNTAARPHVHGCCRRIDIGRCALRPLRWPMGELVDRDAGDGRP